MSYHLRSKAKKVSVSVIITFVVFVVFYSGTYLFPNFFRSNLTTISKPIWLMRDGVDSGLGNFFGFFSSKSSLIDENTNLKAELETLKLKQLDYDQIFKENQELKGMASNKEPSTFIVRVLSKPPISPYGSLVLASGVSEGVRKGAKVFISKNVLIGFVSEVTPHTSVVEFFSKGDVKYNFTLERTGASYDVYGRGGGNLEALVPKEADVLWGDTFIYPGVNSSIIGNVYFIETDSQSSFKAVYIKSPSNIFQTKWVFVEK